MTRWYRRYTFREVAGEIQWSTEERAAAAA